MTKSITWESSPIKPSLRFHPETPRMPTHNAGPAQARRSAALAAAFLVVAAAATARAQVVIDGISFEDVATSGKVNIPSYRGGVGVIDYDNDGFMDLAFADLPGPVPNRLYRNIPDPLRPGKRNFTDVSVSAGLNDADALTRYGGSALAADYDNDGDTDLYFLGQSQQLGNNGLLYRNNGNGTFTNVTVAAGLRETGVRSDAGSWADYDLDGDADLLLAVGHPSQPFRIFRNNGNGTFTNASSILPATPNVQVVYSLIWIDYDNDGDDDAFTLGYSGGAAVLLRNGVDALGNRVFTNAGGAGSGYSALGPAPMGIAAGDIDNDGDFDISITTAQVGTYFRNDAGHMTAITPFTTIFGWGTAWIDVDNDGLLDNYQAGSYAFSANHDRVHRNLGNGQWQDISQALNSPLDWTQHTVQLDLDNDGRMELVAVNPSGPAPAISVYENISTTPNHWIKVALSGDGQRVNGSALGAIVRVRFGAQTRRAQVVSGSSTTATEDLRAHFGLGAATQIDEIEVRWPRQGSIAQRTEVFPGPFAADQIIAIAPYCYSDYDRNGFVNGDDFDTFAGAFVAGTPDADVDGNGFVNGDDFDSFIAAFAAGC